MNHANPINAWDAAAEALETDPMRPVRYEKCLRYISDLNRDCKIAEIGCGEGSGILFLTSLGFHNIVGIEVSRERLHRTQRKLRRGAALVQVETSGKLPLRSGELDAVLSAAVVEHVVDPLAFVREMARVVRRGGHVIISSDCYVWRVLQLLGIYRSVQPIDQALFPTKLFRYFQMSGLDLVHYEGFPLPGQEFRFLRLLARALLKPLKSLVHGLRPPGQRPLKDSACPSEQNQGIKLRPWRHQLKSVAFLRLIFSDENVFFLIKR